MEYSSELRQKQLTNITKAMGVSKYANVTFIVGEDRVEFKVIRQLLAIISPVFDAMLFGAMKEAQPNSVITIPDIEAGAFQSLLNFAYGKNPEISIDNIISVKHLCRKYVVDDLSAECDKFFERVVSPFTVCMFMDEAIKHKLSEYVDKCFVIFNSYICNDIIESRGFLLMGLDAMERLLASDLLFVKEEDLWEAVSKWAESTCARIKGAIADHQHLIGIDDEPLSKRRRLDLNIQIKGNHDTKTIIPLTLLRAISSKIRFGLMDPVYFITNVVPTGCLDINDVTVVLRYLLMKKTDAEYPCGRFETEPRKENPNQWDVSSVGSDAESVWRSAYSDVDPS